MMEDVQTWTFTVYYMSPKKKTKKKRKGEKTHILFSGGQKE